MNATIQRAFAPSSLRNLKLQLERYHQFCYASATPATPVTETQICRYARFLGDQLASADSVQNYLQGVKTWLITQGQDTTALDSPRLKLLLRGLRRDNYLSQKTGGPGILDHLSAGVLPHQQKI